LLLQAERVILNFLQHLSGIATLTHTYVKTMGDSTTQLLDTRKTTPGFRMLEKYAFASGGGVNHRLGLNCWPMFKDNHLALLGVHTGLRDAVQRFRSQYKDVPVEIEVDRLDQIPAALDASGDIILLDNFTKDQLVEAVRLYCGKALLEASGGITLATLPQLANLGLDYISTGAPIHQSTWVDIGLDWQP
jgi:nicotinate-nucleotide pyrophosphorylase (carboxylating)